MFEHEHPQLEVSSIRRIKLMVTTVTKILTWTLLLEGTEWLRNEKRQWEM